MVFKIVLLISLFPTLALGAALSAQNTSSSSGSRSSSNSSEDETSKSLWSGHVPDIKGTRPKTVLWWTPFFVDNKLYTQLLEDSGPISISENCPYQCHFTTDRELLNKSDAVLFHGRAWILSYPPPGFEFQLLMDLPSTRYADQFWIFNLWENPLYTFVPLDKFDNFFNATITYRRDSDIFAPYGYINEIPEAERPTDLDDLIAKKTKPVAWISSHCSTENKREQLVAQLREHIPVDVYGDCGNFKCEADPSFGNTLWEHKRFDNPCYQQIGGEYKFYLSFENSYCKDYVTEKFFHSLAAGMVPVVYGAADYTFYAPNNSFINADDFKSAKELADYLIFLDKNPDEYGKYLEWRKLFKVDTVSFHARAFCKLCEGLTTGSLTPRPAIQNFKTWWWGENDSFCETNLTVENNTFCENNQTGEYNSFCETNRTGEYNSKPI